MTRWLTLVLLAPGLLLGTACTPKDTTSSPKPKSSTTTQPVAPTSSAADASVAVKTVYEEFWQLASTIDKRPESEWRPSLSKVATDPQLTRSVQGLGLLREQSIALYGAPTARITSVDVAGSRATVQDCQDGSKAGQADAKTGKPKTVGVERNPITATLLREGEGRWRVSDVVFGGGACR
ncbi:hypothetical protein M8C13_05345 [Crossiella sp. SN42]|uniref:hypothetical protein n=1 Tax=Crossiella sp. SN42 TaxID=2944808 RepID=UPI00207D49EF|nr:hypothetical protein [Crossiella sp. SN42]MCO1575184.1 hypothetical protein [Crossiella sp. SN42]